MSEKPEYRAPGKPTAVFGYEDMLEVVFTTSPYANFFKVKYSTKPDMSEPGYEWNQGVNSNSISLWGLMPNTKYYFQAAVMNFETDRLSPYSKVGSGKTKAAGSGTWSDAQEA